MKILVLAPPMGATGGIQRYVATLAHALGDVLGKENVRMVAVPAEPKSRWDGTLALGRGAKLRFLGAAVAEAIRWRPHLVLCAHVGLGPAARVIQRISGAPYWVMLYGIEVWGELSPAKLRALRAAQRLVTISKFTLEATSMLHGVTKENAVLLPPAFEETYPQAPAATEKPRTGATELIVLTVGRLAASEKYKGHDVMLEAWGEVRRKIPGAKYVIVGDGDDRPRLEALAKELGVSDSVTFTGGVSSTVLQACYDDCRVFALPARTELDSRAPRGEGFGIVFLEAMARGKPVLGPNTGAPAEFIHSGEHGLLVDPTKPAEVARALIELLEQPERAQRMGLAGREWVRQQYSYEMFCRRLRETLQKQGLIH